MTARRNGLVRKDPRFNIEPYGVFRRSPLDPIFNPYFINYGYDKVEFFERIALYKGWFV